MQELNLIFGSGDYVAVRVILTGTQTGPFGPFPVSGKKNSNTIFGILRVANGNAAEVRVDWDNLNALTQLRHFPRQKLVNSRLTEPGRQPNLLFGGRPAFFA